MSFSYYLLLAEPLHETDVLQYLCQANGFEAYDPRMPGERFTMCRAPGVVINISKRSVDRLKKVYDHFGVRAELLVSFDITKDIDLYDTGATNMFDAVQLLLLKLSCDAALLFNFDDCVLRRINGEITLYPGGIWSPGVEPDLLSRVTFPYRFEKTAFPSLP